MNKELTREDWVGLVSGGVLFLLMYLGIFKLNGIIVIIIIGTLTLSFVALYEWAKFQDKYDFLVALVGISGSVVCAGNFLTCIGVY
jgi:hypothetical protein